VPKPTWAPWAGEAVALAGIPSAWVAAEYLRSHALSGFGWNLLAYSQTPWLPAIQVADLGGAWLVSWLLMLANVAVARAWTVRAARVSPVRRRAAPIGADAVPALALAALTIAVALGYGLWRLRPSPSEGAVRVAVVQGNIAQDKKWDEAYESTIQQTYDRLTRAAAAQQPQVIVWPETSVPGFFGLEQPITQPVFELAEAVGVPLLVGAPMGRLQRALWVLTNSAALVTADDGIRARYDKIHLVPYGEFVPGDQWMPWMRDILPPIGEFLPGRDHTVFELDGAPPFGALVCFEDVFPELARDHVRAGARWLATITNDAWFGKTAAAFQHAQASTLRAVELRVPMVRAANTGWSGCIDDRGRWQTQVQDAAGEPLFVEGVAVCDVVTRAGGSLYRAWGDWFAWLCLALTAGAVFDTRRRRSL
jgi:apolipoprotein N-acyltransferase